MKPTSKRTQCDYSLAFKLAVVDQVEKGEFTYKRAQAQAQAQYQYGIQGCSTILVWLRKHGRLDWSKGTPNILYKGAAMSNLLNNALNRSKKNLKKLSLKPIFLKPL